MKKNIKRVFVLLAVLLCFMTVVPNRYDKKADAVFAEMTIASWLAAGGTLATVGPIIVGLAGAAVIGAAINSNWETIEEYGGIIYDDLIGQGKTPEEIYQQDTDGGFSVTASPDFIASASGAVDSMPATIIKAGNFLPLVTLIGWNQPNADVSIPLAGTQGNKFTVDSTYKLSGTNAPMLWYTQLNADGSLYTAEGSFIFSTSYKGTFDGKYRYEGVIPTPRTGKTLGTVRNVEASLFDGATTNSHTAVFSYVIGDIQNETVINTSDTFGMITDNDYQRQLAANAALGDNQVLTIAANQDMTNATLSDIADINASTYDETRTQTGILSSIWSTIKGIPSNIAAAGVAASLAINAKAEDLWADAGAVWTGLADTAVGIKADVNAKMGALQDAMAGGIDSVRTNIDNMRLELGAGIDSLTATTATWFDNVGTRIDTGIDALTGKLTDVWTGVAAIPAAIAAVPADIVTSLTELAVPTAAQTAQNNTDMNNTRLLLASKFDWIRIPIDEIKSLYGQRKSFFDVSVIIMGQEVVLLPAAYAATVGVVRNVMSGTMIMMTIIFIYRRVQPSDVV